MIEIQIWIARDEGIYNEDYELIEKGKLHLFYDSPLLHRDLKTNTLKFDCARCIGEIPSYMYPWIKEGDCYKLTDNLMCYKEFRLINI